MNAAKLNKTFYLNHPYYQASLSEGITGTIDWTKSVFACMVRVAKRNRQFTVDDVWAEIERAKNKGQVDTEHFVDHRIIGPMLRHMVREGLIGSTGYYTKSTRKGGGSRPVTVWESYISTARKVAA